VPLEGRNDGPDRRSSDERGTFRREEVPKTAVSAFG
jgi:hypothetical protein